MIIQLLLTSAPEEEDVVAGWTAFAVFALLIVAVVILGFSLTKRLRNVDRAADEGRYDPSEPRKTRPARGLAAVREQQRAQREQASSHDEQDDEPDR